MATSPSPLPTPAAQPATNPLALSLQAIATGIPQIDGEVALSIAQTAPHPDAALQTAQASQAFVNGTQLKQYLEQQGSTNQLQAYQQFDASTQQMLKGAGYKPPAPHRSLWGQITNDVGHGFHDVLNAAGAPLRAEQHIERTLFAVANQSATAGSTGSWSDFIHALHTPADWAAAWEKTTNGAQYILPQVQRQVQNRYDDQTYQAALAIAEGKNTQAIVQKADPSQQQALGQLFLSARVQQAAKELMAGHVSTGRMLARSLGLNPGPGNAMNTPGSVLGGLTDAVTDWFGDPVLIGATGLQVYKSAKYFVQTGADVQNLYRKSEPVKAAFQDIADRLQQIKLSGAARKVDAAGMGDLMRGVPAPDSGALGAFASRYRALLPALDEMMKENLTSGQDVANFFSDMKNLEAITNGRPASLPGRLQGGTLPHLSRAGLARQDIKQKLLDKIDFAADTPWRLSGLQPGDVIESPLNPEGPIQRIATAEGLFFRHLLTLTPSSRTFNPYMENWYNRLSDVFMMSLPRARANTLLTDYANAGTIGERRLVFKAGLAEVFKAAGADQTPEIKRFMDEATNPDNEESPISHASFSAFGKDLLPDRNGVLRPQALARGQVSDNWPLPTYKDLYAQVKKTAILRAVNGPVNSRQVDWAMNNAWKPLALARFGFSLRVAGEETFGLILRNGALDAARARAAASAVKRRGTGGTVEDTEAASTYDNLTSHLPQAVRNKITSPADLVAHYIADATNRAMAGVEGKLAGPRYLRAAQLATKQGILDADGAFGRYVAAGERHTGNFYDSTMSTGRPTFPVWDHGKVVQARLNPTGGYANYATTATQYTYSWYKRLREIANDPWLRPALLNADLPMNERVDQIAQVLQQDAKWQDAARSAIMRDGRQANVDATADDLARDHAATIIDHVDYHVQSPDGTPIEGLAGHLIDNRRPPSQAALDLIPEDQRPASVSGPELVPVIGSGANAWTKGINAMFHVIGKQIDWISRTPMFMDNFAKSLDAYEQSGHLAMWRKMFDSRTLTKVVDKSGQPLRVYHGTPSAFEQFAETPLESWYEGGGGGGYYFTSDPEWANTMATLPGTGGPESAPNIHMAYLDIRNPVYPTKRGFFNRDEVEKWKAAGHDGVIYKEAGAPAYMVFDVKQIRRDPATLVTPGTGTAEKMWVDAATDRALGQTIPYIHNPELRSQMSIITRNVVPFWFAQEQFLKRWGRTMAFSPAAFRKAQLISQGVAHSGFTHTDPTTGSQYFIYPGAGAVQDVLTHALGAFGFNSYLPIEANLRGQVKMASPGLERLGLPNLGPAVVVPLKVLTQVFPELRKPAQSVEGPITSQSGYLTSLVPTTVRRVWQDFTATPNNSSQYASAMMQAIQYLEASGHGIGTVGVNSLGDWAGTGAPTVHGNQYKPGDFYTNSANQVWVMQGDGTWRQNTPQAMNSYMNRVKNWTRTFLITRTIFGFNVPASPENQFDPNHVNEDFQALLKELPSYQEAVNAFMAIHPDATPYTVFQTKNQAGAPLPATAAAMNFMDANSAFFKAYPLAGAFFIPTQDSSGKYNSAAYQQQLQQQLRVRRTPAEFWQEVAYEEAATQYFNAEDVKNQMLNGGLQNRNAIDQAWTEQSQEFFKANPLFAQQLEDAGGTYTRADITQQLAAALQDPRLPETPQTEDIRTLFNGYLNYQNMIAPYALPGGNSISGALKYQLELAFATQAVDFATAHPDSRLVFDRLIRPALSGVLNSQATAGI